MSSPTSDSRYRRISRLIALATVMYLACVLILLLAPFEFSRPSEPAVNGATLSPDAVGVEFSQAGLLKSIRPPRRLYERILAGTGLTLEAWVSSRHPQRGPARILSYSINQYLRNFTIGQDGSDLVVRLRTTETDFNGRQPHMVVPDALDHSAIQHIVVTYDLLWEHVYVDGVLAERMKIEGDLSNWDPTYKLVIGNEATGNRPWFGRILATRIYDRSLSSQEVRARHHAGWLEPLDDPGETGLVAAYLFEATPNTGLRDRSGQTPALDLELLPTYDVVHRASSGSPFREISGISRDPASSVLDMIANIALFAPLGFGLAATGSRRRAKFVMVIIAATASALFLSATAEALQWYLPGRWSSITDVISNTLGALFGACLCLFMVPPTTQNPRLDERPTHKTVRGLNV